MKSLAHKVALVTGASRGIGKGVALALAAEGATVYVTGRTTEMTRVTRAARPSLGADHAGSRAAPGTHALPGSIHETARACHQRGGTGIAVAVDHANDRDVARLFETIQRDHGRLDVLVNNAFALPDDLTDPKPFWDKPLSNWQMVDVGVRSNFVAAWHAAKLMVPQRSGLILAISGYTGVTYTYSTVFGMCKTAVDRMARDMAVELQPYDVASISLWQGLTFTERAKLNLALNPAMKLQAVTNPNAGCSPEFPGRVIAALIKDDKLMKRSGGTFIAAELAQEFGVTDVDGRVIESQRAQRGAPIWAPVTTEVNTDE